MKQSITVALALALCQIPAVTHAAEKPETLAELKARAESVPPEECVRLCAGIARRAVEEAKDRYDKGADQEGRLLLKDVVAYAEKAADAVIRTKKHEKQLEIDLRDISHHLEALKRELDPEDQPFAEEAMGHLEKLRSRLLESMFGKAKR